MASVAFCTASVAIFVYVYYHCSWLFGLMALGIAINAKDDSKRAQIYLITATVFQYLGKLIGLMSAIMCVLAYHQSYGDSDLSPVVLRRKTNNSIDLFNL